MSDLRVVFFTGSYNHIADGVSRTLNRLVAFLNARGDTETLVIGPTENEPAVSHSGTFIPVPSIPLPGRSEYRLTLRLPDSVKARIREFDPSIAHVVTPDLLGIQGIRFAREEGWWVVGSYHTRFDSYLSYYNLEFAERPVQAYLRWFYGKCERVYVPTQSVATILKEGGLDATTKVWPGGVDTSQFSPEFRSIDWRVHQGVPDTNEVVVTLVSRLVHEKNLDGFISVIRSLRNRDLPVRSMVVGDGPAKDYMQEKLPDTIFTGHLEGEELSTAYASSDIFLFLSDTETFGTVTLEAMASGLPVVCAEAPGNADLVEHGYTGFLAPPSEEATIAEYVAELVRDTSLRRTMAERARDEALKYEWDRVLQQMRDHYRELTSTPVVTD